MAAHRFGWFDEWRHAPLSCACGWSGELDPDQTEPHTGLLDFDCPQCNQLLAMISYPLEGEVEDAAKRGHPAAIEMMPEVSDRRRREAAFEAVKLKSVDQLPDLEHRDAGDDGYEFVWDLVSGGEEKAQGFELGVYTIHLGDVEIWREPARWEDWPRFNEVKEILVEKYAGFKCMRPTERAQCSLYGDDLGAPDKIELT